MLAGTRVLTPAGPGVVAYVRMAPPTYSTPIAVSVKLDGKGPGYTGSMFQAFEVKPAPFWACPLCGQHITDGKPCGCGAR